MVKRRLTVHPANDNGLDAGNEEECDPTGAVRVHQLEEDDPSLERERERSTVGKEGFDRLSSIISIFPPDLADERQPQEEADHSDGQDQQLPGMWPAQLPREQVGDGRGQALHANELGGNSTK